MPAPLPDSGLVRIDSAACPEHGNVLPEMIVCPFTIDTSLLKMLTIVCGACAQDDVEQALLYPPDIEWAHVDEPGLQHWADIGFDPDAKPQFYPIWDVRPVKVVAHDGRIERTFRSGKMPLPDGTYRTPFTE